MEKEINGICIKDMVPEEVEKMLENYNGRCEIRDFYIVSYPLEGGVKSVIPGVFLESWGKSLRAHKRIMTGPSHGIQYRPGDLRGADFAVFDRVSRPAVPGGSCHNTQLALPPNMVCEVEWMHNLEAVIPKKDWYFTTTPSTLAVDEVWIFLVAKQADLGIPVEPAQLIALPNSHLQGSFPPGLAAIPATAVCPTHPQPHIAVYNRLTNPLVPQYYALSWNSLLVPPEGSVLDVCPPLEVNELFKAMRLC